MRIAVHTHGCRLNQAESDALERALEEAGHDLVSDVGEAEVFVLNTCTITHQADADARKLLRRVRRSNPALRLVVTGCGANADPEALAGAGAEAVLGNAEKESIVEFVSGLGRHQQAGPPLIRVSELSRKLRRERPARWVLPAASRPRRTRPYLKVQDGCDYACSFCIVPSVRGRNRSMPLDEAVAQLRGLIDQGAAEIALTGIHLGTWGRDRHERDALPTLLGALARACSKAAHAVRIRIGSVDPHEVSPRLVEVLAAWPDHICGHLHLPVQSGSDRMLERMRRGHRVDHLRRLLPALRRARPEICIGSDIIVGHPGESESDFEASLELLVEGGLDYAHVFPFSSREGTAAAAASDPIPTQVLAERGRRLREAVARAWTRRLDTLAAQRIDALVLQRPDRAGRFVALTHHYAKAVLTGPVPEGLRGRRVSVQLGGRDGDRLQGRLVLAPTVEALPRRVR